MQNTTFVFSFLTATLASLFPFHQALASLSCEPVFDSPTETLRCANEGNSGISSVLLRNMPPWSGNAGVTIVDICPGTITKGLIPVPGCMRRYCSQESRELAVAFGTVVAVFPPVAIELAFSFVHRRFEIRCGKFLAPEELK